MKRFAVAWLTGAVALLLAAPAMAAPVPWKYNWTPSTKKVEADTNGLTSFLELTDEPGVILNTDNTDIIATNINGKSDAPAGFPDEFKTKGNVSFTLTIQDLGSPGQPSANFLFTGTFNTQDPLDPSIIAEESSSVKYTPTGDQSITKVIGNNEYTVQFVSYTPPPPEGSINKGSIAYHVRVRQLDIQKAPEPSTMLLGGLGASFMGFGAWRKRRAKAKSEVA